MDPILSLFGVPKSHLKFPGQNTIVLKLHLDEVDSIRISL